MLNFKRIEIISNIIAEKFNPIANKHEGLLIDFILIIIVLEEDMKREFTKTELITIINIGIKRLIFKKESKSHDVKSVAELYGNLMVVMYLKTHVENMEFFLKHNFKLIRKSKCEVSK